VRDGTTAIAGSPAGASAFTPNPPGGPAGFTGMITRILNNALGAEAQGGVPHPASNTSGLGPAGTLAAPYAAPPTLAGLAATLVASQAQDSADVTTRIGTETAMRDSLSARLSAGSGVDMDAEMSLMITLQTAYGANARIISAAQAMFTQLLNAMQ
jgi:flagellar hook-associated protein 1 FlgK